MVALKPVARICLSDTKTHPTGVSLHWRAFSAWYLVLSILYLVISRWSVFIYSFTSSRARRMYELFKESSSDKPGADPEAFSSMLESRRMVKCVCFD